MKSALTHEACIAWAERYAATPFNMLSLSTSAEKQPSTLEVLRSALLNADAAIKDAEQLRAVLRDFLEAWWEWREGENEGFDAAAAKAMALLEETLEVPLP